MTPPPLTETTLSQQWFEKAPLGVALIDAQGILIWCNPLASDFLGAVKPGKVMLQSKDWPQFRERLLGGKAFFYLLDEQGFVFTPHPISDAGEKFILLWIIPSLSMETDWITMQQDLLRQRKLANLGRMMAEMAHELNNPLAGISMGCQLIGMSLKKLRKLVAGQPSHEVSAEAIETVLGKVEQELQKITHSTGRAAALRQELLAYGKPNTLILKPYQVNKILQNTLNNLETQPVFKYLTLQRQFEEPSATILCDPAKLEQILYNLLKNAHDATDGQGDIVIRSFTTDGGETVCIEVEDNGPGIPADMLDKIFSPFLTTKPRTGNGLGLSISQQIIQEHGGTFSVYNKPKSGACFRITFPMFKQTANNPA